MAGQPPQGDPAPPDGALPPWALDETRPLSIYLHVPFCRTRCGYCDFNTYTAQELGAAPGTAQDGYLASILAELDLASRTLGPRRVGTIFVGGGTPTLLDAADLAAMVGGVRERFDLDPGAEVTTEANPDSVSPASLAALREGGFTRISFGMQSAVPHVLATLDRVHTPGRALAAVAEARAAGFDDISLDLIYGTPGESDADWELSLDAVVSAEVDHVSAYALIVEDGTRLERRMRRGELPWPDDDALADRYLAADARLAAAGFDWYEVSNWSRAGHPCRHNLAYWRSDDWWGAGPGAHSHVGGVRWWNVRHPHTYAARLAEGASPAQGRETLSADDRHEERVLLELRLAEGLPADVLRPAGRDAVAGLVGRGLIVVRGGRIVLTLAGRLLADAVVRDLVD